MSIREEIVESMARTLFVQAWASYCDEEENLDVEPRAGAGEDWMDCSPETPPAAFEIAEKLAVAIERVNGSNLETLWMLADQACKTGKTYGCRPRNHNPDSFGHNLAMQAVGHGVGWTDNHASPGIKLPGDSEVYVEGYDPETEEATVGGYAGERFVREI